MERGGGRFPQAGAGVRVGKAIFQEFCPVLGRGG